MQFGIFSVGDVTTDPTNGRTPTEAERIKAMLRIAQKAEEVGLDVFATGEHHNPPFVPSSPTNPLVCGGCHSVTHGPTSPGRGSADAGRNGSLRAFSKSAGMRIRARRSFAELRE